MATVNKVITKINTAETICHAAYAFFLPFVISRLLRKAPIKITTEKINSKHPNKDRTMAITDTAIADEKAIPNAPATDCCGFSFMILTAIGGKMALSKL